MTHRAVDADQIAQTMLDCHMVNRKPDASIESDIGHFSSIMNIPVFDPQPQGSWVLNDDGYNSCSICHHQIPYLIHVKFSVNGTFDTKTSIDPTPFCPYCGARLISEDVYAKLDGTIQH